MLWMKWAHPEWFPNDINISLTFSIPFTFICCHITVSQVSYKPESNEIQSKEMDPVSPFYDQWFCTFVFGYSKTNYKIHTLNYKNISAQQFKSSNIRISNGFYIFKKKSLKLWKFKNHLSTSIFFGTLSWKNLKLFVLLGKTVSTVSELVTQRSIKSDLFTSRVFHCVRIDCMCASDHTEELSFESNWKKSAEMRYMVVW